MDMRGAESSAHTMTRIAGVVNIVLQAFGVRLVILEIMLERLGKLLINAPPITGRRNKL